MATDTELLQTFEQELAAEIDGDVRFDAMSRGLFSTDASVYQIPPVGVVYPKSEADVLAAVKIAGKYKIPILPRGGGTSLSGQTVAAALVLDFTRYMNRILEIDLERKLVRVEAGVVLQQLNAALKPHGYEFGPDVSTMSRAAMGGMIGNNSAGSHSVIHGKTIDHVRALKVVLSDGSVLECGPLSPTELAAKQALPTHEGRIYRELSQIVAEHHRDILARYPRILRRVSGYNLDAFIPELVAQIPQAASSKKLDQDFPDRQEFNLAKIIVGAEGTLAVVTEAVLHMVPLPKERTVVCLQFESIDRAVESVPKILECKPAAVEMLDKYIVELSRANLHYKHHMDFVTGAPAALLIVEFYADKQIQLDDSVELLEQKLEGAPGLECFLKPESKEQMEQIWRCREASAPLLLSIPGARKPIAFVEDTAVDPAKLPAFTKRFREILTKHGTDGAYYGHASVGCLHIRPLIDTKTAADLKRMKGISDDIAKLVKEFQGAMTGEHGDGLARSLYNKELFGPRLFAAFQRVKHLFDPAGLLNPDKVTGQPSPIESLRYGSQYKPAPIQTFQDFSHEAKLAETPGLGFLAATEMCNGSGVCRKTHTGTMCPSFMVTKDEEHSTRGRANALRLALSGQLPEGSLTSKRMYDVMDLCLMCKGCKSECPSNVDVAKLKVEFLGHYYQQHRPSVGTVVQANVAWINRIGSAFAPFSNWISKFPGVSQLTEWILGIDHRRSLPAFRFRNFPRWFRWHKPHAQAGTRGKVVLLDDCLTSYCEPKINQSAVKLLEQAGYEVQLAGLWCCGRPFISKGLIEKGKQLARENVAKLASYVEQGWDIVGCEPSCLLTLVDEYPDLFPSDATREVKAHTYLLDDWLTKKSAEGQLPLEFEPLAKTVLLHGHCQQKSLVGLSGTKAALALIPDLKVQVVDSGCCGMAGSFGYEHYEVSMQIGERALFPAIKNHEGPKTAPGFSCRHQIADGTEETACHPVELLAKQLRPTDH